MKKPEVIVIDYGVGNLLSVQRGLEKCGAKVIVTCNPKIILDGNRVVMPGVGAFSNAMKALKDLGLIVVLNELAKRKTPLLGICLGMQLLTNSSEENGNHKGLGIIPGKIKQLKNSDFHIGWNNIEVSKELSFINKFNNHEFFFNHGFAYEGNDANILSKTSYGESSFASAIMKKNTVGFQFHPEKSQKAGLQILKSTINFLIKNK